MRSFIPFGSRAADVLTQTGAVSQHSLWAHDDGSQAINDSGVRISLVGMDCKVVAVRFIISSATGNTAFWTFRLTTAGNSSDFVIPASDIDTGRRPTSIPVVAGDALYLRYFNTNGAPVPGSTNVMGYLEVESPNAFPLATNTTTNVAAGATGYIGVSGSSQATTAIESQQQTVVPQACSISKLYCRMSASGVTGGSFTVTLMKNGVATSLVAASVGGGGIFFNDLTNSVSFSPGDVASFRIVADAGVSAARGITCGFVVTPDVNNDEAWIGESIVGQASGTQARFNIPFGAGAAWSTTENASPMVVPKLLVRSFYVNTDAAVQVGGSYANDLRRLSDPTITTLLSTPATATVTAGNRSAQQTGLAAPVEDGEVLTLRVTPTGSPLAVRCHDSFTYLIQPRSEFMDFMGPQ